MRVVKPAIATLVLASIVASAGAAAPTVHFRVFARTSLRLTGILWTGRQFLYIENTTNRVLAAGPLGMPITPFARMPRQVEETRCAISPGSHGFPAGAIYCHSPDNKIYRISANGKHVTVFALLPHSPRSDGALAFDTGGAFGYTLLAATGRSGSSRGRGGTLFAVSPTGAVHKIGAYPDSGGADEIALAPARFGSASDELLLTVDAGKTGSLVAIDSRGHSRTLLQLPDGPNPIAALTPEQTARGAARPGLYVTDTTSHIVYFAPAAELRAYTGAVVMGSELRGLIWIVRPQGHDFTAQRLTTNLNAKHYNLEGAVYLAPS